MARAIYEIKLKDRLFPATSEEDALEMYNTNNEELTEEAVEVGVAVKEEHVMKLFILAKAMYDTDKFDYKEIQAAVGAVARNLGYYSTYEDVAQCVNTWIERIGEDMDVSDVAEWVIG